MNNKWFKLGAIAVTVAIAGVLALNSGASAQAPGPAQSTQAYSRGTGMGAGMGMMARGSMGGQANSLVAVAAKELDMTQTDLVTALNGGKTIADVAKDKNVTLDKIVDSFTASRVAVLQSAVSAGRLTQAQADANLATMKANVTAQLSAKFTPRGNGAGTGFVDANNDGVCDNLGANGTPAMNRGSGGRGGRWGK